jgi:transposase
MSQRRYKAGIDRQQELLFPPCVDDYINEEHPVRAIDAYVDSLDLRALGFEYTQFYAGKGQPPYAPATFCMGM